MFKYAHLFTGSVGLHYAENGANELDCQQKHCFFHLFWSQFNFCNDQVDVFYFKVNAQNKIRNLLISYKFAKCQNAILENKRCFDGSMDRIYHTKAFIYKRKCAEEN